MVQTKRLQLKKWSLIIWAIWMLISLAIMLFNIHDSIGFRYMNIAMFVAFLVVLFIPANKETNQKFTEFISSFLRIFTPNTPKR